MKKIILIGILAMSAGFARAQSFTPADVEFIAKSQDPLAYANTIEARELAIAAKSQNILKDLGDFYRALDAAATTARQRKFLVRRRASLEEINGIVKDPGASDAMEILEKKLLALSGGNLAAFDEKSAEQSTAQVIHLLARNQFLVFKKSNREVAYVAGRSAFHSALLGLDYLRLFLDLSDKSDARRAAAEEMIALLKELKN